MLTASARAVPDHDGASACNTSAPATVTTTQATARSTATERGRIRVPGGGLMLLDPTRGKPVLLTEAEPAGRIRFTIAPLLAASVGIGGAFAGATPQRRLACSAAVRSATPPRAAARPRRVNLATVSIGRLGVAQRRAG